MWNIMYFKLRVNTMNENQEILYLLDNANHSPQKRRSYLKLFMDINHKGNERGTVLRTICAYLVHLLFR